MDYSKKSFVFTGWFIKLITQARDFDKHLYFHFSHDLGTRCLHARLSSLYIYIFTLTKYVKVYVFKGIQSHHSNDWTNQIKVRTWDDHFSSWCLFLDWNIGKLWWSKFTNNFATTTCHHGGIRCPPTKANVNRWWERVPCPRTRSPPPQPRPSSWSLTFCFSSWQDIRDGLAARGHAVDAPSSAGSVVVAIHRTPDKKLEAVSDWRKGGVPDGF